MHARCTLHEVGEDGRLGRVWGGGLVKNERLRFYKKKKKKEKLTNVRLRRYPNVRLDLEVVFVGEFCVT